MKFSVSREKIKIQLPGFFMRNLRGDGNMYVVLLLGFILILAALLTSGFFPTYPPELPVPNASDQVQIITPTNVDTSVHNTLQLKTLSYEQCTQEANVIALVDVSGSMSLGNPTKISQLKNALTVLTTSLPDNSIFGLYSFSVGQNEVIRTSLFNDVKSQVPGAIQGLGASGLTYTRDAFAYMQQRIAEAQQRFPGKQFTFIFFSDGIPEAQPRTCISNTCVTNQSRCFETTQDPTNTAVGSNIAETIKGMGVTTYSIALLDSTDTCWNTDLQSMMLRIASPGNAYSTSDAAKLTEIFTSVLQKLCR